MYAWNISGDQFAAYNAHLRGEERSAGTVENYLRHVRTFAAWAGGRPVTRELAAEWKVHLLTQDYAPVTINAMLAALNGFFHFLGRDDCQVKFLKVQRRLFRDAGRELTRPEYDRLLAAAREQGRERLTLLLETICATGIRVSEVRYVTVETARTGRAEIALKGKIRTILLPSAMPGIITGVILAIGRIVGESAALLFTAGSAGMLPKVASGYFSKIMQSGGTLTIKLYLAATSEGKFDQAFGIAVVLLVIVFLINILTKVLAKKFQAK